MSARCVCILTALAGLATTSALSVSTLPEYNDPCPFGYGTNCGGGGKLTRGTRDQVAHILEGILSKLSSHKALVSESQKVSKVTLGSKSSKVEMSMPAVYAFQSLLVKLQKTNQAEAGKVIAEMLAADSPDYACKYLDVCGAGNTAERPIDDRTRAQVANILEGILRNLSKGRH